MTAELPQPALLRWQPLRAGLVDLYYYDREEFWFRDGRLLLRGNNGTGKSKVLALSLPFLLDGELAPHRVEPDADPRKRMEWNLLLGGEHPYPERLGYTWLEFGRVDEQGTHHFHTLGCGLKAVSGRGIARHWFFMTSARPGADLALVDATGTALTRDRLAEALTGSGAVYDRARDYRRAVDENLFGFGEQRYAALVDLLVQLRQPQLSKRPSEKALSAALTEALPPLDQAVVTDVAEAFRSLEEDRAALQAMTEAYTAARSFLDHYRRYARIASRRRAAQPRNAQSGYEQVNRELGAAQEAYETAVADLTAAERQLVDLDNTRGTLEARRDALRESPEMRSAVELDRAASDAKRLTGEATRLGHGRDAATGRVRERSDRHAAATQRLAAARDEQASARTSAADAAGRALVASEHAQRIDATLDAHPEIERLRGEGDRLADRQQRAVSHVRELITALDNAVRVLGDARGKLTELDADADDLAGRRRAADDAVARCGAQLVAAVRGHLETTVELRLPDQAATVAQLELWVETLDGDNPAAVAVRDAGRLTAAELTRADERLQSRLRAGEEHGQELADEIARLEGGEHDAPPAPHTRDTAAREGRAGAPLWQLVDFTDQLDASERAGLEAALEAAGVLDAWVTPGGELLSPDTADVVLTAAARAETALSTALVPAVDRNDPNANAVSDATVRALLDSIGLGECGDTWVATDGTYRISVLQGAWWKPAAAYIGRGARDAARRKRLAELRAELATVREQLADIGAEREKLARRSEVLASEVTALPGDGELRDTHMKVAALAEEHGRLAARRETAERAVAAATAREEGERAALTEAAADTGLPMEGAQLDAVEAALRDYRIALAGLWPAVDKVEQVTRYADDAATDLQEAETELGDLTERVATVEGEAAAARERHETLRATVGAAVAELERQLDEVAELLRTNEGERAEASGAKDRAIGARGEAHGRKETLATELDRASTERTGAAESFRRFAGTGLLAVALPHLDLPDPSEPWAPDPTVRLARRVNDELTDTPDDDAAWDRAQLRVNNELKTLQDTLSVQGNRAVADLREDGVVVEVEYRGRPASVPQLTDALAAEVADRDRLLNEREREVLENHLVGEVASTLQELISSAERQVAAMNDELARRPTSTGMRLRLVWKPREDGPAGLAAARERLLRQTADAWSDDDRAAVGGFLQARIAEVRAQNESGTWLEHLTSALDYRAWNRFVIQRHQNGQWRSATGPASGGERVLAASVPLFAAASSHYASAASPQAPRLVTLDEAFAGVDDSARAQYFALLAAFDLDVVMTSEREWGCYPEVPGLAISHLSRREGVSAVLVSNWEWDGSTPHKVDRRVQLLPGAPADPPTDGLWG